MHVCSAPTCVVTPHGVGSRLLPTGPPDVPISSYITPLAQLLLSALWFTALSGVQLVMFLTPGLLRMRWYPFAQFILVWFSGLHFRDLGARGFRVCFGGLLLAYPPNAWTYPWVSVYCLRLDLLEGLGAFLL